MKEITNEEALTIEGGKIPLWVPVGLGLLAVFLVGVWDGFTRPQKCHAK